LAATNDYLSLERLLNLAELENFSAEKQIYKLLKEPIVAPESVPSSQVNCPDDLEASGNI